MTDNQQNRRSARVEWLRNHAEIKWLTRADVVLAMKKAGVISAKTNGCDVNLYNLMRDAGYGRREAAKFSLVPWMHGIEAGK